MKKKTTLADDLNENYQEPLVFRLDDKSNREMEVLSTGSLSLNQALGVGGLPYGRIVEIYGPEASGKTTIAIHVMAEANKKGQSAFLIDTEHAFDSNYAYSLGVSPELTYVAQPDYAEQALQVATDAISTGKFSVVVLDSVAALVPKAELEGQVGDSKIGLQARLMSQTMRMLAAKISKTNTICIFINQLREKIGVMFGSPEVTSGGNALKFYSSIRMDVRRVTTNKIGDEAHSNSVKVKIVKNKVAPPYRVAEFDIVFGKGIDITKEILNSCVERGIIKKSGNWYSYEDVKLNGETAFKNFLDDNPELKESLK